MKDNFFINRQKTFKIVSGVQERVHLTIDFIEKL